MDAWLLLSVPHLHQAVAQLAGYASVIAVVGLQLQGTL